MFLAGCGAECSIHVGIFTGNFLHLSGDVRSRWLKWRAIYILKKIVTAKKILFFLTIFFFFLPYEMIRLNMILLTW